MYCLDVISQPKWILSKQGVLPSQNNQKMRTLKLGAHYLVFITTLGILVLNIIKGIRLNKPMFINRMLWIIIPLINFVAKLLAVHKNENHYLSVLKCLKSEIFNIRDKKLKQHIMIIKKIGSLISKCFLVIVSVLLLAASVLPIVINIEPLMPCPVDVGKFDIIYRLLHLLITVYYAISSLGFDLLLMSLLGICIGQLNILEQLLIGLDNSSTVDADTLSGNIEEALMECITLHKMITEYMEHIIVLLSLPLFIQYGCGCFIICTAVLQLTIMGGKTTVDIIFIATYSCVIFSQMAIYHWLGNEIKYKSCNLMDACYLSKWYTLDRKSQKCIILLMERAKKPLTLKLYTIVYISLESLSVIRWSYSLFALLKATYS